VPRLVSTDEILAALAARYDHASARVVLDEALAEAGLLAREAWDAQELSRLAWRLSQLRERPGPAVQALLELAGEAATAQIPESPEDVAVPEDQVPALLGQIVDAAVASVRERHARRGRPPLPKAKA
jgi:hypothetical protein